MMLLSNTRLIVFLSVATIQNNIVHSCSSVPPNSANISISINILTIKGALGACELIISLLLLHRDDTVLVMQVLCHTNIMIITYYSPSHIGTILILMLSKYHANTMLCINRLVTQCTACLSTAHPTRPKWV